MNMSTCNMPRAGRTTGARRRKMYKTNQKKKNKNKLQTKQKDKSSHNKSGTHTKPPALESLCNELEQQSIDYKVTEYINPNIDPLTQKLRNPWLKSQNSAHKNTTTDADKIATLQQRLNDLAFNKYKFLPVNSSSQVTSTCNNNHLKQCHQHQLQKERTQATKKASNTNCTVDKKQQHTQVPNKKKQKKKKNNKKINTNACRQTKTNPNYVYKIKQVQSKMYDLETENDIKTAKIKIQSNEIKLLNKQKEEFECKYNKLLSQNGTQIHDLQESNKRMQQRCNSMEDLYQKLLIKYESNECVTAKIMDECKELEIKYNELEAKFIEQQKRFGYQSWTTKDLVNWIVGIDKGRYSTYYNDLLENMLNEGIDGMCLTDLDKNDLKGLGITQFKDRVDVYNNIQKLLKKNENHNNQNEGESETYVG